MSLIVAALAGMLPASSRTIVAMLLTHAPRIPRISLPPDPARRTADRAATSQLFPHLYTKSPDVAMGFLGAPAHVSARGSGVLRQRCGPPARRRCRDR